MSAQQRFVLGVVHAVQLVLGNVALDPLHTQAQTAKDSEGLLRDPLEFGGLSLPAPGISRSITNFGMGVSWSKKIGSDRSRLDIAAFGRRARITSRSSARPGSDRPPCLLAAGRDRRCAKAFCDDRRCDASSAQYSHLRSGGAAPPPRSISFAPLAGCVMNKNVRSKHASHVPSAAALPLGS
jgi:hypothetical protein